MLKYYMAPCLWVEDLAQALEVQYGTEFMNEIEENGGLRIFLFRDCFMNDVCCMYSISELEVYEGLYWQDETRIRLENCIKTFLQDIFPNCDYVVIDVMW